MDEKAAVARISAFLEPDRDDMFFLKDMATPVLRFRRGQQLRREGSSQPKLFLLKRGWVASSIVTADGSRQMLRTHLPGDLLGIPSLALTTAHDTLTALSPVDAFVIEPAALMALFAERPRIATALFLIAQEERIIAMDRLVSIGTSNSTQRLAALIFELKTRLARSGAVVRRSFDAPITQSDIGDLIGVSAIHVNRILANLRAEGIATWSSGIVTVLDEERLLRLSGMPVRDFVRVGAAGDAAA